MSLRDAVWSILRGLLQYALYLIPVIKPLQENRDPPSWWYRDWSYWDWRGNLDADNRPNQAFIEKYLYTSFGYLSDRIRDKANEYARSLTQALRKVIGWLPSSYNSFAGWLSHVQSVLGFSLPGWAASAAAGLVKLYYWLPSEIRDGVRSWGQLFDNAVDRAIRWVKNEYDQWKQRIAQAWEWLSTKGFPVADWWSAARTLLDQFRSDPRGFIVARLGAVWHWLLDFRNNTRQRVISLLGHTWQALVTFAQGPLEFYYNLWGAYKRELGEFFTDPMEYLYRRAEQFLADKLG